MQYLFVPDAAASFNIFDQTLFLREQLRLTREDRGRHAMLQWHYAGSLSTNMLHGPRPVLAAKRQPDLQQLSVDVIHSFIPRSSRLPVFRLRFCFRLCTSKYGSASTFAVHTLWLAIGRRRLQAATMSALRILVPVKRVIDYAVSPTKLHSLHVLIIYRGSLHPKSTTGIVANNLVCFLTHLIGQAASE